MIDLLDLSRISSSEADDFKVNITKLCALAQSMRYCLYLLAGIRTFISSEILAGDKLAPLTLFHGNASLESGFSVNKELRI